VLGFLIIIILTAESFNLLKKWKEEENAKNKDYLRDN
jgi:hypothetical protein